jgi:AbrB family looped-hinge helix DNA binding protein
MRITSKGQVTIPQSIREKYGFMPDTEIDFIEDNDGVRIAQATEPSASKRAKAEAVVDAMIRRLQALEATDPMTTEELMRMTRGDEWPDLR